MFREMVRFCLTIVPDATILIFGLFLWDFITSTREFGFSPCVEVSNLHLKPLSKSAQSQSLTAKKSLWKPLQQNPTFL